MKTLPRTCLLSLGLLAASLAAKTSSDLLPRDSRQSAVNIASHLARPVATVTVAVGVPNPFNPPGFESPDSASTSVLAEPATARSPAPLSRSEDILAAIALRLPSPGKVVRSGVTYLGFPQGVFTAGDSFAVDFQGRRVVVEIATVSGSTFTLRLDGAEVTRPIAAPGRSGL